MSDYTEMASELYKKGDKVRLTDVIETQGSRWPVGHPGVVTESLRGMYCVRVSLPNNEPGWAIIEVLPEEIEAATRA
jgi:hypothetical protein